MVLKRILPSQVEIGMYVQSFQGNWLRHPFWRAQFLVEDGKRLEALRNSELDAVIIDTELGADLPGEAAEVPSLDASLPARALRPLAACAPAEPASATPHSPARMAAPRAPSAPLTRGPLFGSRPPNGASAMRSGPVPLAREFGNARLIEGKARKVISRVFIEARLGKAPRVSEVAPVVEDIHASIERNPYAFSGLMRCKAESEPIYRHMLSTSALMISLARQMRLPPAESRLAGMAGLLLDVGVSKLDVRIAEDAGGLARLDPELWQRHSFVGRDLLEAAGDMPTEVLQAVARHHEHLDGSGQPAGLAGRELDPISRMAAVCDHYDLAVCGALTGSPQDPSRVLAGMIGDSARFDGEVVARLVEALGVYPIGAFVLLRSERIAMVVDQEPDDPERPVVRAFFSAANGRHIAAQTIALANCFGEDAIVGVADLSGHALPGEEELRHKLMAAVLRAP